MTKNYFSAEYSGAKGTDSGLAGEAQFVIHDNPNAGKQFRTEGAKAIVYPPRYDYLPKTPDEHGQYKLFNYTPATLADIQSSHNASPSSILEVLALARQHAAKHWGSLTYSENMNPTSSKIAKKALERGDIVHRDDITIDDATEDYGQSGPVSGRRTKDLYEEHAQEDVEDAVADISKYSKKKHPYVDIKKLPEDAGAQAVKEGLEARSKRRENDPQANLAIAQEKANAEYDAHKSTTSGDLDLFGDPVNVRGR
jgi:hypothetical protein